MVFKTIDILNKEAIYSIAAKFWTPFVTFWVYVLFVKEKQWKLVEIGKI